MLKRKETSHLSRPRLERDPTVLEKNLAVQYHGKRACDPSDHRRRRGGRKVRRQAAVHDNKEVIGMMLR